MGNGGVTALANGNYVTGTRRASGWTWVIRMMDTREVHGNVRDVAIFNECDFAAPGLMKAV